jgi:hypothetical protein
VFVRGEKTPAASVEIILYRHDVLEETGNASCDLPGSWEIISINASPWLEEEPIHPSVLMYNHFGMSGGTTTKMSNDEFVAALEKSFKYWRNKINVRPVPKGWDKV